MKTYLYTTWRLSVLFTKRVFRSRVSLFFGVLFPLVLLFIFGALYGSNNGSSFKVALINQSHTKTSQQFEKQVDHSSIFKVKPASSLSDAENQLNNSTIDGVIVLPADFGKPNAQGFPGGQAEVLYNQSGAQGGQEIASILNSMFAQANAQITRITPPLTVTSKSTATSGLTGFDYAFTGLIGFSLLGLGIFGPINTLPALKKTGALVRFRTTPLRPLQFIIAYAVSSIASGVVSIGIQFIAAIKFFHFHLNGSLIEFTIYALLAAIMLFGFGMAVGGWANDEKQSAPLGNLVSLPMMFLGGVFFPRFLMPEWLQQISSYIPLSPAVDGLRMIATQHKTFADLGPQLGIMVGWLIVIYIIAFRVFRWE